MIAEHLTFFCRGATLHTTIIHCYFSSSALRWLLLVRPMHGVFYEAPGQLIIASVHHRISHKVFMMRSL